MGPLHAPSEVEHDVDGLQIGRQLEDLGADVGMQTQ